MNSKLARFEKNEPFNRGLLRWLVSVNPSLPLEFSLHDIYQVDRLRSAFSFISNSSFQMKLIGLSSNTTDFFYEQLKAALSDLYSSGGKSIDKYWLGKKDVAEVENKIILAVAAGIMWMLMQTEEEAVKVFDSLAASGIEEEREQIRIFFEILATHVDSMNIGSERRLSLAGHELSKKMYEYEKMIESLQREVSASSFRLENEKNKNEELKKQNLKLQDQIRVFEKKLGENEEHTISTVKDMEKDLTSRFVTEKDALIKEIKDLEKEIKRLKDKNSSLETQVKATEDVSERLRSTSKALKEEAVPKSEYAKLMEEKTELLNRLTEQENSVLADTSQTNILKDKLENQRKKYEDILAKKEKDWKNEIFDLRKRNEDLISKLEIAEKNLGISSIPNIKPNRTGSPMRADNDDSITEFLTTNSENRQILAKLDEYKSKLDEMKTNFNVENDGLRKKLGVANDELNLLKSKNYDDRSLNKSQNAFNSRGASQMKNKQDLSEEFVDKLVKTEKQLKKSKFETKMLQQKMLDDICYHKYQTDLLLSTITAYFENN